MNSKRLTFMIFGVGGALALTLGSGVVLGHKEKHSPEQLKAFNQVFMEQVRIGDLLWHGDPATQEEFGVNLSNTGMACAMCHPDTSDAHPQSYPKFQEQMSSFATFRDMVNWCIEKPNQGVAIDPDGEAMKAIEAYANWANRGSKLNPGEH